MFIPALENIRISFTNWDGLSQTYDYISYHNYAQIMKDQDFWNAIFVTFKIVILVILIQQTFGILLAVILEKNTRKNVFLRSLFFIPCLLNTVVVGLIFSYALNVNFGILNNFFNNIGLQKLASIDWLGDARYASWAIVMTIVWQYSGYSSLLYLGALKDIPKELYESCELDGASPWQRFWKITFPLISPALTLNCLITLIGTIRLFDIPFVLTNGGPAKATQTIAMLLYRDTFHYRNAGRGAANATILMAIIIVFSVIQTWYLRKREVNM